MKRLVALILVAVLGCAITASAAEPAPQDLLTDALLCKGDPLDTVRSLEELLADFRDFLRAEHAYALKLRKLNKIPGATYETFRKGIEHPDPAIAANVIIGLIRDTTYLLARQLRYLENAFVEEGGLRERMTRARIQERQRKS